MTYGTPLTVVRPGIQALIPVFRCCPGIPILILIEAWSPIRWSGALNVLECPVAAEEHTAVVMHNFQVKFFRSRCCYPGIVPAML